MKNEKELIKICWVQHSAEYPLFQSLSVELAKRGYTSIFVCKTKRVHNKYVTSKFTSFYASSEIFFGKPIPQMTYNRLVATYGDELFEKAIQSDVQLLKLYPKDSQARKTIFARSLLYWEDLITKESVDYFILRESAMFLTRSAYYVAKHKGIPCGRLQFGPGENLCLLYDVGELDIWSELDVAIEKGVFALSDSQIKEAKDFVTGRLPRVDKKMTMRHVSESVFSSLKQYAGLWWYDTKKSFKDDPVYIGSLRFGRYRKQRQLFWNYVTKYLFNYVEVDENDKIVYFPTYSGLETSYLVHAPQWARREKELILKVAQSLPSGYKLYVKEHPLNPGDLSFFELIRLSKEPNIKIVKPEVSSQYLIEQSRLVITIQGTAGWEAFLSKKPVLCIENVAFYGRSALVYKVTDMAQLLTSIQNALNEGASLYKKCEDEWHWFIYSVLTTAGRGNTVNHVAPYGFITNSVEMKKVSGYIHKKIEKTLHSLKK